MTTTFIILLLLTLAGATARWYTHRKNLARNRQHVRTPSRPGRHWYSDRQAPDETSFSVNALASGQHRPLDDAEGDEVSPGAADVTEAPGAGRHHADNPQRVNWLVSTGWMPVLAPRHISVRHAEGDYDQASHAAKIAVALTETDADPS